MKTYVVPEIMELFCDVQDIALSPPFSEREYVGVTLTKMSYCKTAKQMLTSHFSLHFVDFSVTCIAKFFAPGKTLFCIGKLRLSVIHRNDTEGDIGTI